MLQRLRKIEWNHASGRWNNDRGSDVVEYALITALIVLAIVAGIHAFWSSVNKLGQ